MTILSSSDVTTFVRELLGEREEKHWSDTEITLYIKFGIIAVYSKYWYMLAPSEATSTTASLVANTDYVSQPDDCAKVLRVEVAENRALLKKIEPDELWKYSKYDDGAASANYLNIWYLEYPDAVTDLPEALRPLVAVEAVLYAKSKDAGVKTDVIYLKKSFEEIANTFLATDSLYQPTLFGDESQDQAFTDSNPCAWIFKGGKIYLYRGFND